MLENKIPKPSIIRLCTLYRLLGEAQQNEITNISSSRIAQRMGESSHSIRKDISYLGDILSSGGGYDVDDLRDVIAETFGLNKQRSVCVIGLGDMGKSLLNSHQFNSSGYKIVAGFDSNVNRIETMKSDVDLYPLYTLQDTLKRKVVELALLAVAPHSAQDVTDKLVSAGIKGIINFTPIVIQSNSSKVFIQNIDFLSELNVLSAFINLSN